MRSLHEHSRTSRTTWHRRRLPGTAAIAASLATIICGIIAAPVFAADGDLTFVECLKDTGSLGGTNCLSPAATDGLDGAFAVAVSPDDRHLYVGGFNDDAIATFSRNGTTGKLPFVELDKDGVGGVDGIACATGVTISPDGRNVYVGGFNDDAVAIFSRNQNSGRLAVVGCLEDTGGRSATCPSTGGIDGLNSASFTPSPPDGKFAYVSGPNDDAIATFSRDPNTGQLTFISCRLFAVGCGRVVTQGGSWPC